MTIFNITTKGIEGKEFPYFATDDANRIWLIMGHVKGDKNSFDAFFAEGNESYRPFEYRGVVCKSNTKKLDRSQIRILIGNK